MTYSHSQLSTFNRCIYLWQLQYQRGIRRVSMEERVELGTAVHAGLAAHFRGDGVEVGLGKWADALSPSWRDIKEDNPDIESIAHLDLDLLQATQVSVVHRMALLLCLRTIKNIGDTWEVMTLEGQPLIEHQLKVGDFEGYVDLVIREKETDFCFLVDFKVRASLQDEPAEDVDQQMALYQHLLALRGVETMGSIVYQIRSVLPKKPKLNQNGTMSRAEIASDWETYRAALIENNLEPSDYVDMQHKLMYKEFFKPVKTYRSPETVQAFWDNARHIVDTIQLFDKYLDGTAPRSFNSFNCPSCLMSRICRLEFDGQPTDHLFVRDYTKERNNE